MPLKNNPPLLIKSTVRAHTRKTKTGKVVQVRQHTDIRSKKADEKKETIVRDVGEKIGGARKDLWKDLAGEKITKNMLATMEQNPDAAHKNIRKKNLLLPVPSEEEAEANGVDVKAHYLLKHIVKNVPERPGNTRQERENYIIAIDRINGLIRNAKTEDDIYGYFNAEAALIDSSLPQHQENIQFILARKFLDEVEGIKDEDSLFDKLIYREKTAKHKMSPLVKLAQEATYKMLASRKGTTNEEKKENFKKHIEEIVKTKKYVPTSDSLLLGQKWIHFLIAGLELGDITDKPFDIEFSRMKTRIGRYDATKSGTHSMVNKMYGEMRDLKYDPNKVKEVSEKGGFKRDVQEEVVRTGGKAYTSDKPEDLMTHFDIRAVEFGKYIDEKSGEYHVQHAGEAFTDLATVLELPGKYMGMQGRLAMAFGARGAGQASAHYEPLKEVINITKWRGGGSIAHEWGHFLDNILGSKDEAAKNTGFASDEISLRSEQKLVPESIRAEYLNVMKTIHQGDGTPQTIVTPVAVSPSSPSKNQYTVVKQAIEAMVPKGSGADAAKKLDVKKVYDKTVELLKKQGYEHSLSDRNTMIKVATHIAKETNQDLTIDVEQTIRGTKFSHDAKILGAYWKRPHELFARAFESYIQDKMHNKGMENTYLVSGTKSADTKYTKITAGMPVDYNPYPTGKDRIVINAAMDKLMTAVRQNKQLLKSIQLMLIKSSLQRGNAMSPKPMLIKSTVRAHTRRNKSGKLVQVRQHQIRSKGGGQDLSKLTATQQKNMIDQLSKLSIKELRGRQDLNSNQQKNAYAQWRKASGAEKARIERGSNNLSIMEKMLDAAVDKKSFKNK